MPKVRAYGADATLLACRETSYGVTPLTGYRSLDFKSCHLSTEQPLGDDPLLGRGRNAQDPDRGLITDEGRVEVPLDLRGAGFWLTGLFGDPATVQTKSAGHIAFAGLPAANSTIALNGVTWTFVTGTPTGNQTQIGAIIEATLTALASDLSTSADAKISKCTYTVSTSDDGLEIEFDAADVPGNSFTLAASANSNGTVSAPTLTAGGYRHEWLSGGNDIPNFTVEIGHPQLITPVFFRHLSTVMESLAFEMGREGRRTAPCNWWPRVKRKPRPPSARHRPSHTARPSSRRIIAVTLGARVQRSGMRDLLTADKLGFRPHSLRATPVG
ncbi:MAG: hypothetical protein HWD60_15620 [Defluviicoccus sp.]|nr:MAG: hypothetical protein HWD60_15620 [Defluviicoccus sp.]